MERIREIISTSLGVNYGKIESVYKYAPSVCRAQNHFPMKAIISLTMTCNKFCRIQFLRLNSLLIDVELSDVEVTPKTMSKPYS